MNWLKALLGFFGLATHKFKYHKTEFKQFVMGLASGTVILTSNTVKRWFSGAVSAVTGSPVDHAATYIGKTAGDMIREKYPELLGKRVLIFKGKSYDLGTIPAKAEIHEIIESGLRVEINQLEKYDKDTNIMEAWSRALTQQDLESVLFNLYLMVGMPYDVQEILSKILPVYNPTMENMPALIKTQVGYYHVSLRVCSSLQTKAYAEVEKIVLPGIDPEDATPGDLRRYFKRNPQWSRKLFNTKAGK